MRFPFEDHPRFELVRAIGEALYGPMYLVKEREGDRLRVIGVLEHVVIEDVDALRHELEALTRLNHPLLTGYDDLWCEDGRVAFERQYIEGRSFDEYLEAGMSSAADSSGEFGDEDISLTSLETLVALDSLEVARDGEESDPHEVGDIFAELSARAPVEGVGLSERLRVLKEVLGDVLSALEFLHRYKRAHGALHPGCLVIDEQGRCNVTEHGLAALLPGVLDSVGVEGGATARRQARRSRRALEYRAPEVVGGEEPGPWSDIYSLGCVIFEAICGVTHHDADGRTLLELAPSCGSEWAEMVASMLAPGRRRRGSAQELQELLARARVTAARLPSIVPEVPETMSGRSATSEALVDAIAEARREPGLARFVLEGEMGAGKRQALRHVARELGVRGWLVLRAECYPDEPEVYQAWGRVVSKLVELLRRASGELLQDLRGSRPAAGVMFPALSTGTSEREDVSREDALDALTEILSRVSRERPLLIVLDNAWHLDEDAIVLLQELSAPRGGVIEGALVLTSRQGELERLEGARRRVLPGMDVSDALEMSRAIVGDEELAALAPVLERHPVQNALVLKELLFDVRRAKGQRAREAHVERICEGLSRASSAESQYKSVVAPRVERLDEDAQHLLGVLAVSPGPVKLDVLSGAARRRRRAAPASQQSLTMLCALRLAKRVRSERSETPAYRVSNELCREVVLAQLGEEGERRMFTTLARAYERVGEASAMRRFWAYRRHGDVVRAVERAGRAMELAASRFAYAKAASVGEWVLEARTDWDEASRRRHVEKLAVLEGKAGRHSRVASLYREMVKGREPGERRVKLQVAEARAWHLAGEYEDAVAALSEATRHFGERYTSGSLSGLMARFRAKMMRVTGTKLAEFGDEEEEITTPEHRLRAALYEAALETQVELNSARAIQYARQLEALGRRSRARGMLASAYAHRACVLIEHDVELAGREAARLIETALTLGAGAKRATIAPTRARLARARLEFHRGQYDACARSLSEVERGQLAETRVLIEGELAHRTGDAAGANTALETLDRMGRSSHLARMKAAHLGVSLALTRGDLEQAEVRVDVLVEGARSPAPSALELFAVFWRARLDMALGRPEVVVGTLDVWMEEARAQQLMEIPRFEALMRMVHAQSCAAELEREVALESSQARVTRARLGVMRSRLRKLDGCLWPVERAELHRSFARFELLSGKRGAALKQVDQSIGLMTYLESPGGRARSAEARARVMLALEQPDARQLMAQAQALQAHLGAFAPLTLEGWGPCERLVT